MTTGDLSIAELGRALRAGLVSSEQITRDALDRIAASDATIHAFVAVDADNAMSAARTADLELRQGHNRGLMHGIPYAVKDIIDVAGMPTTCHSKLRLDHVAEADAEITARFRNAGAIMLGKLATFEFALGGPSFDLPFPPTRNPWNTAHVPGGSSSGSAAAVAAGFVRTAIGSCTAGSIRGPAAWCGTVGMKPTYGRVSRRGVFPLAWSLDHCGPLSRSVEDAAISLQVMAGHDPLDPSSATTPVPDFRSDLDRGVAGLHLGVPRAFFEGSSFLSSDVREAIEKTLNLLREHGACVEDISLPDFTLFHSCNRVIMNAEAYALHKANLQQRWADFGEVTVKRFVAGISITASEYLNALRLRRRLSAEVDHVLARYDGLVTAVSLATAPHFDTLAQASAWPLQSSPFNLTGHPAMSVPVGLGTDGLPLAVQVVGRPFDEPTVFRIGRAIEYLSGWDSVRLPSLPGGISQFGNVPYDGANQ